jgi:hypothetical protein
VIIISALAIGLGTYSVGGREILPIDGQLISPLAVSRSPHWRPRDFPTLGGVAAGWQRLGGAGWPR